MNNSLLGTKYWDFKIDLSLNYAQMASAHETKRLLAEKTPSQHVITITTSVSFSHSSNAASRSREATPRSDHASNVRLDFSLCQVKIESSSFKLYINFKIEMLKADWNEPKSTIQTVERRRTRWLCSRLQWT